MDIMIAYMLTRNDAFIDGTVTSSNILYLISIILRRKNNRKVLSTIEKKVDRFF